MGVTFAKAGGDLANRIGKIATAVKKGERDTLLKGGLAGKDEHVKRIRKDSGGDMRLSGVNAAKGRAGNTKVGARFNIKSDSVEFAATGPLQIIANDTSGHVIRSAYAKGRRRKGFVGPAAPGQFGGGRRAVLKIPGVGFRRSARHPGTKGKDTWNKATPDARKAVADAFHDRQVNIIRRALG